MSSRRTVTRRAFLHGAGLGVVGVLLAACGPQPTPQVIEKEATRIVEVEKVVTPTLAPKGPVALEFWQPFGGQMGAAIDALNKTWNDQHPDIQVKVSFQPRATEAGNDPKFLAAALAGHPPDVYIHDGSSFSTSIVLNAFTVLDDMIQAKGLDPKAYFDFAWTKVVWEGHVYGLPLNTDARALFWNKKMLQEAGFDKPPVTIDELDAVADKLTKKSGSTYERMGFIPWIGNWGLFSWGWDFGATLWDPDAKKMSLNHPGMVEALDWEVTYAKKYGVAEMQAFQSGFGGGANDPFLTGQVAMIVNGDWIIANLEENAPSLEYDITPTPYPTGRAPMTFSGGFDIGVPRGGQHIEEAFSFIWYMASVESATYLSEKAHTLPTVIDAAKALVDKMPRHKIFLDLLPVAYIEPVIPEWSEAFNEQLAAEQAAIYLQKTAKEALDEANEKVQKSIDERVLGSS